VSELHRLAAMMALQVGAPFDRDEYVLRLEPWDLRERLSDLKRTLNAARPAPAKRKPSTKRRAKVKAGRKAACRNRR
jgi:hypothetical protein